MNKERKFIYNLTKLAGPTKAVDIDTMFEALSYINKNSVIEAQFIEASYLESIFTCDDRLQICTISNLCSNYEEATSKSDDEFLTILGQKHIMARQFLDNDSVKQQIKDLIEKRKLLMERNAALETITGILDIIKYFPQSKFSVLISPLLPDLVQSIPQTETGDGL